MLTTIANALSWLITRLWGVLPKVLPYLNAIFQQTQTA